MLRPTRLALATLLLPGCLQTETTVNQNHCATQTGDAWCAEKHPAGDRAFCNAGPLDCSPPAEERPDGCVATRPAEDRCYSPCGDRATVLEDGACLDPSGPTTETETTSSTTEDPDTETDPETDTMDASTSTGGPTGCQGPDDCQDAAAPFCVDEVCVPCSGAAEPDVACAELDPAIPLCVDDVCVQCTDENADACGDVTPLCDTEAMTCVACEFHEQCQDLGLPACNIATGACFNADDVSQVNGGTAGAIQTAIDGVADGAAHAIVLTGDGAEHGITIDGGKTIAIVSSNTDVREVDGNEGSPTITVTGDGSTAYLHRLQVTANTDDWGVSVESSATLYADSTQVVQNSGGGVQLAAGTTGFIRNSMIQGEGGNPGIPAVSSNTATVEILYSTLGLDFNSGGPVLACNGGSVAVRNSILVSETNTANSKVDCPSATIEDSAERTTLAPDSWFPGFAAGDYSLNAAGGMQFNGIAVWQLGDPPFDFDGHDRPNEDGASDYAGADVP